MPKNIATPLFDITTVIVTLTKSAVRRTSSQTQKVFFFINTTKSFYLFLERNKENSTEQVSKTEAELVLVCSLLITLECTVMRPAR